VIVVILVLTAGTAFLMWLGEQINEKGIGNGISLLIFAGIVDRIPSAIRSLYTQYTSGNMTLITIILLIIAAILVIAGVVLIQEGQRKIPVQYAKRVVGRKMYGGQSTHIPVKVNQSGVIPIIFALSLLQFPLTITYFLNSDSGFTAFVTKWLSPSGNPGVWVYGVLNVLLIIFFTYFYNQITFNPVEIADNLKSNGGFIPGIRPGKATSDYLAKVTSRITIVGAIFLAAIATLPTILSAFTSLNIHFGGTSLLIAVGVALETVRVLENQMMMRNYQGFLK
jgi:preprotein translocase subunit SecY